MFVSCCLFLESNSCSAQAVEDNTYSIKVGSGEPKTSDTTIGVETKVIGAPPFKISGSISRHLQQLTGLTFLSEAVSGQLAKSILKRKFGGKIKVKIKAYSCTDLIHLKVKSLKVTGTDCHYKDVPLGKVQIESLTPFWLVLKKKKIILEQPICLGFKMLIGERELDQLLHCGRVTNSLKGLRLDLTSLSPGLDEQSLQMHEPEVSLVDDLVVVKTNLTTQGADPSTAVSMTVSGQPTLHGDNCIFLEQIKVDSPDITEPEKFSKFVETLINPLINLHHFDRTNFAMRLNEISIKSKKLSVSGRVIMGPSLQSTTLPAK